MTWDVSRTDFLFLVLGYIRISIPPAGIQSGAMQEEGQTPASWVCFRAIQEFLLFSISGTKVRREHKNSLTFAQKPF